MKKIDLHLHTVVSPSDKHFDFCLEKLKLYISQSKLDGLAITNHNLFDIDQYNEISENIDIPVFPGIEIDLEKGHILVITEPSDIQDFKQKADQITKLIPDEKSYISIDQFKSIFSNLSKYLLIPHYNKSPSISQEVIEKLKDHINAGEVDSLKKFIRVHKDSSQLVPVYFSDIRIDKDLEKFPKRQTYIDCGSISLTAIKNAFKDRNKIAISESDGNNLFEVFDNGQMLSTGLNILLGDRSSGKTVTLEKIYQNHNAKYIKQFALVQQDEEGYKKDFEKSISTKKGYFVDEYLSGFKKITEEVSTINLDLNEEKVDRYLKSLLLSAAEVDLNDSFSKASLFNETLFDIRSNKTLQDLTSSALQLLRNIVYKSIIEKHIRLDSLKALFFELVETLWKETREESEKEIVNSIIIEVKKGLHVRSAATSITDLNLYDIALDMKKVGRFNEIAKYLAKEETLKKEVVQGFTIEVEKHKYQGALEVRTASKTGLAFSEAFKEYNNPYKYLQSLLQIQSLDESLIHKLFTKIEYKIKNKDGSDVSGGERSEFRLLEEIQDAQNYDILLIDEPESSFDNIFLKTNVNKLIKEISTTMPVVVVTHNNTIGASVKADYILYCSKTKDTSGVKYRVYAGYPNDTKLCSADGDCINHKEKLLHSLEAGEEEYLLRQQIYESIKN